MNKFEIKWYGNQMMDEDFRDNKNLYKYKRSYNKGPIFASIKDLERSEKEAFEKSEKEGRKIAALVPLFEGCFDVPEEPYNPKRNLYERLERKSLKRTSIEADLPVKWVLFSEKYINKPKTFANIDELCDYEEEPCVSPYGTPFGTPYTLPDTEDDLLEDSLLFLEDSPLRLLLEDSPERRRPSLEEWLYQQEKGKKLQELFDF